MSETLNPISSTEYGYPTDNEFSELRETGKQLVEQKEYEDAIAAQMGKVEDDEGFIADSPGQALKDVASIVPGAAVDAVESIGSFLDLSGDTLTTAASNLFGYEQYEADNPFSDNYKSGNWFDVPDQYTPETKSGFGKLLRGIGEFGILAVLTAKTGGLASGALGGAVKGGMAGTKIAGAASKIKAGNRALKFITSPKVTKWGKVALEGAGADFIMNDSEEANIANLVDMYAPALPFSQALAVNEEDNPWSARIKSVTAGAGVNILGHALVGFLKGKYVASKKAKELAKLRDRRKKSGKLREKLWTNEEIINEANAAGTKATYDYIRKNDYDDAAEARIRSNAAYAEGKGYRSANAVDNLDLYLRKWLEPEDYEEVQRLFAGEDLKGDITIKDPELGDFTVKEQDRIVDTRGKGTYYHGTDAEIDKLTGPYDSDAYFGKNGPGLFGYGFYTTDDIITANKYKNKNVTKAELSEPLVYQTREKMPVEFYDLDAPMSKTVLAVLDDMVGQGPWNSGLSESIEKALGEIGRDGSLADLIREARMFANYDHGITRIDFAESVLELIENALKGEGYGGYTHKGGIYRAKGKRTHQVRIYWDPGNQLELGKTSTETATLQDYINFAKRKGARGNDAWLEDQGMSQSQERFNRFRKPDPDVNPTKFPENERFSERTSTDTGNPYTEYVEESTKLNNMGYRPVGSTNMSTTTRLRQMTGNIKKLRQLAKEIMDNTSEEDFLQIDNAQPFVKRLDTYVKQAQEINDIIASGGDESIEALRRYLSADIGSKKTINMSDLNGRKNFIFWDFDGDRILTITPQMALALRIAVQYNLKQASDIATGVMQLPRGANPTRQAMDILDHIQLAMVEMKKISYMSGAGLEIQKGRDLFDPVVKGKIKKEVKRIELEEKTFTENLKEKIRNGDVKQARQLTDIYAITNGSVTSMSNIQNYLKKRLGWAGGEINGKRIPPQIWREVASVYYNSILSAPKTGVRAIVGTNLITVLRPFQMWVGATLKGDKAQAAVAASTIDAIGHAYAESWKVFKYNWDQGVHNKRMTYMGRFDRPRDLENFKRLAEFANEFGTPAEQRMYGVINNLVKMNTSPWMRYSQNLMGAGDAASRTVLGRFTARIRAAQEGIEKGVPLDNLTNYAKSQEQRFLDEIFEIGDGNQFVVTDKAALMAGAEATMTRPVEGWSKAFEALSKNPIGMIFFPFVRTSYNAVRLTTQHTPLEMFTKRYRDIMAGTNLEKYGLTPADWPAEKALMEGRIAMGSMVVTMAMIGAANGNIYGDVPRDKETRDLWKLEGIKPYTYRIGNTLVSYRDLEPFNTIIATAANLFNYQHALDEDIKTEFLETLTFMTAAALVDKSMLAGVDDLASVLDPQGLQRKGGRLFAQTARSALPWSGLIGSIGDVLDANEKEAQGMLEIMFRRDAVFKSMLSPKYDILAKDRSGKPFMIGPKNPLLRALNFLSPIAVTNTSGDPVKTMLYEIGYNLPEITRSYKGLRLTSEERSLMSKYLSMSNLRSELEKVMKSKSFQNGYKEFKELQLRRRNGYRVEDQEFYRMVARVFRKAKKQAYQKMIIQNPELGDKLKEARIKQKLGQTGNYKQIEYLIDGFPK